MYHTVSNSKSGEDAHAFPFFITVLRVCPWEDQAGLTHAISLIFFKVSQFLRVTKLIKNPEWFRLLTHHGSIRAPTTNPWSKRLKIISSKNVLSTNLSHTNRMWWILILIIMSNGHLNLKETNSQSWGNLI